jgi:predicted nucleotidyltransferase
MSASTEGKSGSDPGPQTLWSEIESRRRQIADICVRLGVRRLELFGSAARGGSPRDLDFLVDLGDQPPAEYAGAYFALREELEKLFARPIDLVTPAGLANPYFRRRVEQEKTLLYTA